LPDGFHHLVPTIIFNAKRLCKMPNLTYLAVRKANWQIWL